MSNQARLVDAAAAAVTLLNSSPAQATFSQPFTSARAYRPVYDLTTLKSNLKVTVVPKGIEEAALARLTIQGDVAVDVAVQNYVDPANQVAACDALMLLVQQIKTVMEKGLTLPESNTDCGWISTTNDPAFDPEHLQQKNVFTSVATFTYLTRRAR